MSKVDFALEMDAFKPHICELLPKLDFGFALNVYWAKFSCGLRRLRPGGGGYSNLTSMSFNHVPAPTPNHRLVVAMACIIELVTCRINLIRRVKVNELRCEWYCIPCIYTLAIFAPLPSQVHELSVSVHEIEGQIIDDPIDADLLEKFKGYGEHALKISDSRVDVDWRIFLIGFWDVESKGFICYRIKLQ